MRRQVYLKDELQLAGRREFSPFSSPGGQSVQLVRREDGFLLQVLSAFCQQVNVTQGDIENYHLPPDYFQVNGKEDFARWLAENRINVDLDAVWDTESFQAVIR